MISDDYLFSVVHAWRVGINLKKPVLVVAGIVEVNRNRVPKTGGVAARNRDEWQP